MNNSDSHNLIYLILLLIIILSGFISRRNNDWSLIFKYLFYWSLVGFVGVIIYSYRFEFLGFKNRIMGEINPRSVRVEGENIIINISEDGHFYINLMVNDSKILFMIDTGASDLVLSKSDAIKVGINLNNLNFNKTYQTANGISWGASIILKQIQIGNIKFYNVNASVNQGDMGSSLLGMSFLRQFHRYEFFRDKLILTP